MPDEELDLNDAIAAAAAEATSEVNGEETTAPEETPETTEAAPEATPEPDPTPEAEVESDEDKPDPEPVEEEEEPLGLSADALEQINADPKLQAAYKLMQRGLTKKATDFANKTRELEEKANVADWVRDNPDQALKILADRKGIKLPDAIEVKSENDAVRDTVDDIMKMAEGRVGPEAAKVLGPLVKDIAELVATNIVRTQVDPLKADIQAEQARVQEAGVRAQVDRFGASVQERGDEWSNEIVSDMADEMKIVSPNPGIDPQDFLDAIYDRVMMKRTRSAAKRTQLKRLREAKATAEPTTTARPTPDKPSEISADMDDNEAIALAVAQATSQATA